ITDNCANYPEADCSRYANASLDEFHDDCLQAYGGEHITITSSRFYNCATQGIFAGNASGGTFADWTIENTMVGGIPGGQSNHAIIIGGGWAPGDPPLYRGRFRFVQNTTDTANNAAMLFYPSAAIDPRAVFLVAGNITNWDPPCSAPGQWIFR